MIDNTACRRKPASAPEKGSRACRAGLLIAAFLMPASPAFAADAADLASLSLEDLLSVEVSGASRLAQSVEQAPASVTVIAEEELRGHGYRTLGEALVTVPGVYSSNDRSYTFLGVRGFNRPDDYGTRILLLTDGARRNDPLFDQALFGNEAPIEIDWLKRLEFVTGPVSAIYGANALFGVANAVMLDGADVDGSRISLDAGSENTRRLGVVAGRRLAGDRDWFFGFAAYKTEGSDFSYPEFAGGGSDGFARGLDSDRYQKAYGKFRWGNWRLAGNFSTRTKDLPTAPYGTSFGESGTRVRDQSSLVELRYEGDADALWQPSFRLYSGEYRYSGHWIYSPAPDARDRATANWIGSEYRVIYNGFAGHRLLAGVDAQWNTRVRQLYGEIAPERQILATNNPSRNASVFVEDEWRLHADWLLSLALRQDKHSDFATVTSPRAALIWQATPRLTIKAMRGSAFRTPNAYERFYNDGNATQAANPALDVEHIESRELAAVYRFGSDGRAGMSVYRNRIHDLIDPVTDQTGVSRYVNRSEVTARGIELSAENRWAGGLRLRASAAWQKSEGSDGEPLFDSPRRLGKLVFGLPLAPGWSAAGEIIGVSARQGAKGQVPGHGLVNLSLRATGLLRCGDFSLNVYNLGDRRYYDPGPTYVVPAALGEDGRQVSLRWTLSL